MRLIVATSTTIVKADERLTATLTQSTRHLVHKYSVSDSKSQQRSLPTHFGLETEIDFLLRAEVASFQHTQNLVVKTSCLSTGVKGVAQSEPSTH